MLDMTSPTSAAPEFVDLVCADLALLHAEFEAIVAANFTPAPPDNRLPGGESGAFKKVPTPFGQSVVNYRATRNARYALSALRRQRSPPSPALPWHCMRSGPDRTERKGR
jgi:hypothetical protein